MIDVCLPGVGECCVCAGGGSELGGTVRLFILGTLPNYIEYIEFAGV